VHESSSAVNPQKMFSLNRISVVILADLKSTTCGTTALVAFYAMRPLYVHTSMRSACIHPKVSQTSHIVQSPLHIPQYTGLSPTTFLQPFSTILTHSPQEVVLLDSLPPLVPHGLGQPASCLSGLLRSLHAAVSAGEIHTLLVERNLRHERIRIHERALAQGFGGALALFL